MLLEMVFQGNSESFRNASINCLSSHSISVIITILLSDFKFNCFYFLRFVFL